MHEVTWSEPGSSIKLGPAATLYNDGSVLIKKANGELQAKEELFVPMFNELAQALSAGHKPKIF